MTTTISSYACSPETAAIDFKYTLDHCRENSPNKAYHLIQAFAPGEVSFEEAHRIGKELADKVLEGKYSYVVTTHIDKSHVHNHIIFCAAYNIEHDKYHDCKQSYYRIRKLSDELCKEHNLSVIIPSGHQRHKCRGKKYNEWLADKNRTSSKPQIRKDINFCIKSASTYEEFLLLMRAKGYEIKGETFEEGAAKYISFRPLDKDRFVRGSMKSWGKEYTKERIKGRIEMKQERKAVIPKKDYSARRLIDTSDEKFQNSPGLQRWAAKANRSYHIGYKKAKNPDAYFRRYESQIILYGGARRMLEQAGTNLKGLNVDKLKAELEELTKQKNELTSVYCKIELPKVANGNWRMLHLQIGESCKTFAKSSQERCSA